MPTHGVSARRIRTTMAIVAALVAWPLARAMTELAATPVVPAHERALAVVRAVHDAQAMYRAVHGYYDRIECLVQDACVPNPYPPTYLAAQASKPRAFGYEFRLVEGPPARPDTTQAFSPTGMTQYGFVARRVVADADDVMPSFCADEAGVHVYADGRVPVAEGGLCPR